MFEWQGRVRETIQWLYKTWLWWKTLIINPMFTFVLNFCTHIFQVAALTCMDIHVNFPSLKNAFCHYLFIIVSFIKCLGLLFLRDNTLNATQRVFATLQVMVSWLGMKGAASKRLSQSQARMKRGSLHDDIKDITTWALEHFNISFCF